MINVEKQLRSLFWIQLFLFCPNIRLMLWFASKFTIKKCPFKVAFRKRRRLFFWDWNYNWSDRFWLIFDCLVEVILNIFEALQSTCTCFLHWKAVFRIRISFHADPDPGSQKCPYGSGSKKVNTKEEEEVHKKFLNQIFQNDIKKSLQINKQTINLSITKAKGILLLFLQFCFHLLNLYIS